MRTLALVAACLALAAHAPPEQLVEISLFTQVWKKDASGWKLARVVSHDHRLTDAKP